MLEVNVFSFMIVRGDGLRTSPHAASGGVPVNTQHHFSVYRQMTLFLLAPLMVYLSVGMGMLFEISSSLLWTLE